MEIKRVVKRIAMPASNSPVQADLTLPSGYSVLHALSFEFGSGAVADMVFQDELASPMMVNGVEIFPEGYDIKRFVSGINVQPCLRKCILNREVNCNGVQMNFSVRNTAITPAAHQIKLIVWLSTEPLTGDSCMC